MTPQQLIDNFRQLADDLGTPPLWTDSVLMGYASEGQVEIARRTRCLVDSTTPEICQVAVVTGTAVYDVDPRVIFIRRAKLADQPLPLPKVDVPRLDLHRPGWDDEGNETPCAWLPWDAQKIRLFNTPAADGTLNLIVVREPLADIALAVDPDPAVDPEVPRRYHNGIVNWMLHRAYLHRERQDMYRPEESKERLAMFEEEFGKKSTAADEEWIHRHHGYDENEGLK